MNPIAAAAQLAEQRRQILALANPHGTTARSRLARRCAQYLTARDTASPAVRALSWTIGWDLDRIDRGQLRALLAEHIQREHGPRP